MAVPVRSAAALPGASPAGQDLEELKRLYSVNLLRQLMDLSQALNRQLRERAAELGHHGLKMSFVTVMAHVGFGSSRLSDIAALHGLSKQAVSQVARELVDLGYIELTPDAADARARAIVVTERGRALLAEALGSIAELRARAAAVVGADRFAAFEAVTAELRSHFAGPATVTPASSEPM